MSNQRENHNTAAPQEPVENRSLPGANPMDLNAQKSVNGTMDSTLNKLDNDGEVAQGFDALRTNNTASPAGQVSFNLAPAKAVSYVRVSTQEQAAGGRTGDGFSIPAQKEYNQAKAHTLGALVAKEFVDRGVSGTTLNRPALKKMLQYLEEEQGKVDYVIVHKLDRLARNRENEVTLMKMFNQYGVQLVSATETLDSSPSGQMLQGILSSVNQWYSQNLANEVQKGMSTKAKQGGTHHRAPLGYLNHREFHDGHETRTIIIDPERHHLITWAFKQYATGEWTTESLAEELTRRGLRTRATPKRPSRELDRKSVQNILRNPYYIGKVSYKGVIHDGQHPPLIDASTFQQVQDIMGSKLTGERSIKHENYLKSILWCQCGGRMMLSISTGSKGTRYPYFSCGNRASKKRGNCRARSIPVWYAEQLVQQIYDQLSLTPEFRQNLEALVREALALIKASTFEERSLLENQLKDTEDKQRKLLEAHYNNAIPMKLLTEEQAKLERHHADITRQLSTITADLDHAEAQVIKALDLAENCGTTYQQAPEPLRRMLNQAIFEKIIVYTDETDGTHTLEAHQHQAYDLLLGAQTRQTVAQAEQAKEASQTPANSGQRPDVAAKNKEPALTNGLLTSVLNQNQLEHVLGVSKGLMVEARGLEPLTSSLQSWRSTN